MARLVRSALLGGVVLFGWGSISWMMLPWHDITFKKFKNEWVVMPWMKSVANGSGVYLLPAPEKTPKKPVEGQPAAPKDKGPFAFVVYSADGTGAMGPRLGLALAADILAAGAAAWLLSLTAISGVLRRALFVKVLGIFAGLAVCLPNLIWWGFSPAFTLVAFLDLSIGWFLAGLAMAKLSAR